MVENRSTKSRQNSTIRCSNHICQLNQIVIQIPKQEPLDGKKALALSTRCTLPHNIAKIMAWTQTQKSLQLIAINLNPIKRKPERQKNNSSKAEKYTQYSVTDRRNKNFRRNNQSGRAIVDTLIYV